MPCVVDWHEAEQRGTRLPLGTPTRLPLLGTAGTENAQGQRGQNFRIFNPLLTLTNGDKKGLERGRDLPLSKCWLKSELGPGSFHSRISVENWRRQKEIPLFLIPYSLFLPLWFTSEVVFGS